MLELIIGRHTWSSNTHAHTYEGTHTHKKQQTKQNRDKKGKKETRGVCREYLYIHTIFFCLYGMEPNFTLISHKNYFILHYSSMDGAKCYNIFLRPTSQTLNKKSPHYLLKTQQTLKSHPSYKKMPSKS